jgi:hypothetical protein
MACSEYCLGRRAFNCWLAAVSCRSIVAQGWPAQRACGRQGLGAPKGV